MPLACAARQAGAPRLAPGRPAPLPVSPPACLAAPSHTDADASLGVLTQHLRSSPLPHKVVLDCTASDYVATFYRRWMEQVWV